MGLPRPWRVIYLSGRGLSGYGYGYKLGLHRYRSPTSLSLVSVALRPGRATRPYSKSIERLPAVALGRAPRLWLWWRMALNSAYIGPLPRYL